MPHHVRGQLGTRARERENFSVTFAAVTWDLLKETFPFVQCHLHPVNTTLTLSVNPAKALRTCLMQGMNAMPFQPLCFRNTQLGQLYIWGL